MSKRTEGPSQGQGTQSGSAGVSQTRYKAETRLLKRAVRGDTDAAASIVQYLGSASPDLRQIIQSTLHDCLDPAAWHQLLYCLAYDCWQQPAGVNPPAEQNRSTAYPLQEHHTQTITEAYVIDASPEEKLIKEQVLKEGLGSGEESVLFAAAYLNALRGKIEMVDHLRSMVESGHPVWQLRAVQALVVLHDERCGPILVDALARYQQPEGGRDLHIAARHALSDLGRLAEPALLVALNHPDSHIRWHAARGLGQIGDPRGAAILAGGLYDENQAVRWATASVLAGLDATAVPAILKALVEHELDEPFRQAAHHALNAMQSSATHNYLEPLIQMLHDPVRAIEVPRIANRMLAGWENG